MALELVIAPVAFFLIYLPPSLMLIKAARYPWQVALVPSFLHSWALSSMFMLNDAAFGEAVEIGQKLIAYGMLFGFLVVPFLNGTLIARLINAGFKNYLWKRSSSVQIMILSFSCIPIVNLVPWYVTGIVSYWKYTKYGEYKRASKNDVNIWRKPSILECILPGLALSVFLYALFVTAVSDL